ncbi:MAG: radical SAM protein [Spirochaetes bacterium]|nr:radical SAM protein [Spirochaetota bacterium]
MIEEGRPILPAVIGDMVNPTWEAAEARVLIVRLSRWKDLGISTSHLVLFDEARRSLPKAYLDFAFLPPARSRKELDARGEPWFSGRVSGRSPAEFDLVMVSNAFALELINLPYLFTTSGLPAEARERKEIESAPIVILGGSNASAAGVLVVESPNPGEPAAESLVDGIFFGEGEDLAGSLAALLVEGAGAAQASGNTVRLTPELRKSNLEAAAAIPGFWPCLHSGGENRALAEGRPRSLTSPLVLNGSQASTARLSISSGCPGFCSFCLEGWDRSPYAEADFDRLVTEAKAIHRSTGASDLELYSFNFNTYGRIAELIFELNRIFRRVSFMSQRLDILADTPGLMPIELAAGKRSFTLGVEGISPGMRAYYRKGLSEAQIDACIELCLRAKAREIKLFYIIAGLETDEDLVEFGRFTERLGARKRAISASTKILASAGFLVRLPFTPLQFAPLELDIVKLEGIGLGMKASCEAAGIEFRLASSPQESFVDQALSLLGPQSRPWFLSIPSRGIVYESGLPASVWTSLKPSILKRLEAESLVGEKNADFRPPLAFSEPKTRLSVLYRHYLEARERKDRQSCLGSACSACGACGNLEEMKAMTGHSGAIPGAELLAKRLGALITAKERFHALPAALYIPESLAGAESSYRASWILRRLFGLGMGMDNLVFETRERFFVPGGSFPSLFSEGLPWYGWGVFELYGPSVATLASRLGGPHRPSWIRPLGARPVPGQVDVEFKLGPTSPALAKAAFTSYAASKGLSFTARKEGEGWAFDMTMGSIGRKLIASAWIGRAGEGLFLRLGAGGKADLRPLVETLSNSAHQDLLPRVLGWEGFAEASGDPGFTA